MEVEKFRGYVAAIVAAVCVVGGGAATIFVWVQPATEPPRELALIFSVLGGLIGAGSTFLFMADSASRASHASERSFASGSYAGSTMPEQAREPVRVGVPGSTPAPGPLDDAAPPTP